jgi:predicted Zn-dependent peptidase
MFVTCDVTDRCAPEDLAKERGAVMEELRMSNDTAVDNMFHVRSYCHLTYL